MSRENEFKDLYEEDQNTEKMDQQISSNEEPELEDSGSGALIIKELEKEEQSVDGGIRFNEKKESLKAIELLIEEPGMTNYALRKKLNEFYRRNVVNYLTLKRWRKNFFPRVSKKYVDSIRKKIKERKESEKELNKRLIKNVGDTISYYSEMVIFLEKKIQEIEADRLGVLDSRSLPSYTNSINSLAKTIKEYQDSVFEYSKFLELEKRLDEIIREIATIVLEKFLPLVPANLRKAVVEDFKTSMMDYRRNKLMGLNIWEKDKK